MSTFLNEREIFFFKSFKDFLGELAFLSSQFSVVKCVQLLWTLQNTWYEIVHFFMFLKCQLNASQGVPLQLVLVKEDIF